MDIFGFFTCQPSIQGVKYTEQKCTHRPLAASRHSLQCHMYAVGHSDCVVGRLSIAESDRERASLKMDLIYTRVKCVFVSSISSQTSFGIQLNASIFVLDWARYEKSVNVNWQLNSTEASICLKYTRKKKIFFFSRKLNKIDSVRSQCVQHTCSDFRV